MLTRRRQIMAAIGTEGTFGTYTSQQASENANILVYDVKCTPDVKTFQRNPQRSTLGALASVIGSRMEKVTLRTEMRGSGTAGVAPSWGRLLRACGFSETVNAGTASASHPLRAAPTNKSTASIFTLASAVSGTFSGTKSGTWRIMLKAGVASTSATFACTFFPGDGSAATIATDLTFTNTTPQLMALGLSLAPATAGTGFSAATWRVGDEWYCDAVSSSQAETVYKPISDSIPCLDLAVYQDGRIHKLHSCRGTVKGAGKVDEVMMLDFEFWGIPNDTSNVIVDGALLSSIPFEDVVAPTFLNLTATLGGTTPQCFTNFSFDMGNELSARQCATSAVGYDVIRINDREVTGQIDPLAAVAATSNPFNKLFAGTTQALVLQCGSAAGNIIRFEAPRVQITNVGDDDRDGENVDTLDLLFCEPEYSAAGTYEEIKLIVK